MSTDTEPFPTQPALPPDTGLEHRFAAIYGRIDREPFPIPAVRLSDIDARYLRHVVNYSRRAAPGTIVIEPHDHFLYLLQEGGTAIRYGVGVGRAGFAWSGVATIHDKQEWPTGIHPRRCSGGNLGSGDR